jgi:VanZ family protein
MHLWSGFKYWKTLVAVSWILILSFTPGKAFQDTPTFPGADWIVHACMYAVLSLIMIWEGFYKIGPVKKRPFVAMSFWMLLIGGFTELVQSLWIPGRYGDPMDLLANYAGFLGIYWILKGKNRRPIPN